MTIIIIYSLTPYRRADTYLLALNQKASQCKITKNAYLKYEKLDQDHFSHLFAGVTTFWIL